MFILNDIPCVYLIFAIIWSFYQGYRGFKFQRIFGNEKIKGHDKILLLCIADAFTFFISALFGFFSLFWSYQILRQDSDFLQDNSIIMLLIFLLLFGILGVTGKLPDLLNKIDVFTKKAKEKIKESGKN